MTPNSRRVAVLAVAAAVYTVAAWMVAPGFYDGFGPQQPYNWVCPPPQAGANLKPSSGHLVINVIGGVSDANSAFTNDGQIVIGFLPGAFDATGKTSITVDITPLATCPNPQGVKLVTNVYQITADAPLKQQANLEMVFSNLLPAPIDIYTRRRPDRSLPAARVATDTAVRPPGPDPLTGLFRGRLLRGLAAARGGDGRRGAAASDRRAGLIVVVVLGGLPLAIMRRRRPGGGEAEEEEDDDDEA